MSVSGFRPSGEDRDREGSLLPINKAKVVRSTGAVFGRRTRRISGKRRTTINRLRHRYRRSSIIILRRLVINSVRFTARMIRIIAWTIATIWRTPETQTPRERGGRRASATVRPGPSASYIFVY